MVMIHAKIYLIVHSRYVWFTVCQVYLNAKNNNEVEERRAYGMGHAVVTILENTTHLIPHVSDLLDHVR